MKKFSKEQIEVIVNKVKAKLAMWPFDKKKENPAVNDSKQVSTQHQEKELKQNLQNMQKNPGAFKHEIEHLTKRIKNKDFGDDYLKNTKHPQDYK